MRNQPINSANKTNENLQQGNLIIATNENKTDKGTTNENYKVRLKLQNDFKKKYITASSIWQA